MRVGSATACRRGPRSPSRWIRWRGTASAASGATGAPGRRGSPRPRGSGALGCEFADPSVELADRFVL